MKKFARLLTIGLGTSILLVCSYLAKNWYYQANLLHAQEMLATIDIPVEIRDLILQNKLPKYASVMRIDNNKIFFATELSRSKLFYRDKRLLTFLENISKSENLPDGFYLISTADNIIKPLSYPILTFAGSQSLAEQGHIVLFPDYDAQRGYQKLFAKIEEGISTYPWQKKVAKIFWRGANTGYAIENKTLRTKFLDQTKDLFFIDAGFTKHTQFKTKADKDAFAAKYPLKNKASEKDALQYKYLIDVDGNSCSYSRMAWILYSNSLLLKHKSDQVQWYYSLLEENVHYLPIAEDFSNIESQFRWAEEHTNEVQTLITNASNLAKKVFSEEAVIQAALQALQSYQMLAKNKEQNAYARATVAKLP